MGVYKLWQLLLTIARPINAQDLGGRVLAIDASIWIVKIDSLYSSNAEKLKSMLSKIMLLKRNNILPLFVFDGVAPALKRKTLEERYRKRLVAGEQEARKLSELQIMRMVQGNEPSARMSEKARKAQKSEAQLQQLNKTLKILSDFHQKAEQEVGSELLEKIAMQSQILNAKYKIMLQLTPALVNYQFFLPPEEYEGLDLEQKMEYLDELEQQKWRAVRVQRRQEGPIDEQAKLMRDLQAIKKKNVLRQMQDALFRKMMQKNVVIKDGYQIVETIYNGRKVVQKRKVKQEGSSFGFNLRKGKMKNNAACLNFQTENLSQGEEQDDFLAEFCSSSVSVKPKQTDLDDYSITNTLSMPVNNRTFKQSKQPKPKKEKKTNNRQNNSQSQQQVYLPFQHYQTKQLQDAPEQYVNLQELNQTQQQQQEGQHEDEFQDKDHLPTYIPNQSLLHINYSNDNIQLQNLLKVLGIPYLIAPSQAEAQCAALQQMGIVDGVVTEDSDAFLFGAKHVFRGVFQGNIRMYDYRSLQERLRMNREKLIIFALLLGSDYTAGVKGVGLVNAMEILKIFGSFEKLQSFKRWARLPDVLLPSSEATDELLKSASPAQIEFYQLHRKFKNHWYVDEQFGSRRVVEAYLEPQVVDYERVRAMQKEGAFSMQPCKVQLLERLLRDKLTLEEKEFQHFMRVLTMEFKMKRQNTLLNYFSKVDNSNPMARIRSKRLQKSLIDQDKQSKN